MTLLSDGQIYKLLKNGESLKVSPIGRDAIQPASIDVRLGPVIKKQARTGKPVSLTDPPEFDTMITRQNGGIILYPGNFYLGSTIEQFVVGPNVSLKIEGKSTLGRMGLEVHSTAGWIDPGFNGQITLEMKVVGVDPVEVRPSQFIAQVCVFQLQEPAFRPYGHASRGSKYQNQQGPTGPRQKTVGYTLQDTSGR